MAQDPSKACTGASHLIAILNKLYEDTGVSICGIYAKFDVLIRCSQGGKKISGWVGCRF